MGPSETREMARVCCCCVAFRRSVCDPGASVSWSRFWVVHLALLPAGARGCFAPCGGKVLSRVVHMCTPLSPLPCRRLRAGWTGGGPARILALGDVEDVCEATRRRPRLGAARAQESSLVNTQQWFRKRPTGERTCSDPPLSAAPSR